MDIVIKQSFLTLPYLWMVPQTVSHLDSAAEEDKHVIVSRFPPTGASKGSAASAAIPAAEGSSCIATGLRSPKWLIITAMFMLFIIAAVVIPCVILLRPRQV